MRREDSVSMEVRSWVSATRRHTAFRRRFSANGIARRRGPPKPTKLTQPAMTEMRLLPPLGNKNIAFKRALVTINSHTA